MTGHAPLWLVVLGLVLIIAAVAVVDGLRGERSWRDWWRSLR